VPSIVGLWIVLLLAAPAQPINLNLPPPAAAPAPTPRPLWSNFHVAVPKPASRLAWLPAYFRTVPKPPGYDARRYGHYTRISGGRSSCPGSRR
jgi:hypothetical protein